MSGLTVSGVSTPIRRTVSDLAVVEGDFERVAVDGPHDAPDEALRGSRAVLVAPEVPGPQEDRRGDQQ